MEGFGGTRLDLSLVQQLHVAPRQFVCAQALLSSWARFRSICKKLHILFIEHREGQGLQPLLLHCYTVALLNRCTVALLHRCTVLLLHRCTVAQYTEKNWCAIWVKLVCQISTECAIVYL